MWRSQLNKSSTSTKVSKDLLGKIYANACINSINFNTRARNKSSTNRENAIVHMCKETGAVMQEIDRSWVNRNSRNKNKRKGLATDGDGNISNIQNSTIYKNDWLQECSFCFTPINVCNSVSKSPCTQRKCM